MDSVIIGVKGDRACFSMPSVSRQNRFSYPVITATAAIGVLNSIFKKPEFDWIPRRIAVIKKGRRDLWVLNEIKFPPTKIKKTVYAEELRIQTMNHILRDVEYIIEAVPYVTVPVNPKDGTPNSPKKYTEQFNRAMHGKKAFYRTPCLGLREFVARTYPVESFPDKSLDGETYELPGYIVGMSYPNQRNDEDPRTYTHFETIHVKDGILEIPWFHGSKYKVQPKTPLKA